MSASSIEIPSNFSFTGKGLGHGVGLSQIGGKAMANNGATAQEILSYYYPTSVLEQRPDNQIIRVNIGNLLTAATMRASTLGAPVQIIQSGASSSPLVIAQLQEREEIGISLSGTRIALTVTTGGVRNLIAIGKVFTLRWGGTRYLEGNPTLMAVKIDKKTTKYRYGEIRLTTKKDKVLGHRIEITNTLQLGDEYLWGVSEVPSNWPTASLDAQAIVARSYAIARGQKIRKVCDCNLYGSTKDQVFAGFAKENERLIGQLWKEAVTRTSGQVLTFNGEPIAAFYTSSTGGLSETTLNAWGSNLPYIVSVPDPMSGDATINPRYATWQRTLTQELVARAFMLPDIVDISIQSINSTGTVGLIKGTSSAGLSNTIRGETFRSRTQIPSAWFSLI